MKHLKIFDNYSNDNVIARKIVIIIIDLIKNNIKSKDFIYCDINISFVVDDDEKNIVNSYCDKNSITIIIKTNFNYSVLYYKLLFSIRHELEHLRQNKKSIFYKPGRVRNSYYSEEKKVDTISQYLKLIDEKEANIKAIYLISKKLKITFDESFDYFIKDIEDLSKYKFTEREYKLLKNIYLKLSHLPKYNFNFKY
jgi:hypothetical protein